MSDLLGIHHVTALSKDGVGNVRFHAGVLGLRPVKRTVNFDDPSTWHLYFADRRGTPGTTMTYFPHPMAAREDRDAAGQTLRTVLAAPPGTLAAWRDRLAAAGVEVREEHGELVFEEPDGTRLGIAEDAGDERTDTAAWEAAPVPAEQQLRGFDRVVIGVRDDEVDAVAEGLVATLGFADDGPAPGGGRRLVLGGGGPGRRLDVRPAPVAARGRVRMGTGSVHHVAWRVPDEAAHGRVRQRLVDAGLQPTEVIDRDYFLAIYCRMPGGLIFEFSTDGPGFTADEPEETLGASLRLPARYEPHRGEIEARLQPSRAELDAAMAEVEARPRA